MAFVRNNIRYRSAAAKALEGYYNAKAFFLNDMIKQDNGFSETARELLLLLFNKHADWLSFSENRLLNKQYVSQQEVEDMKTHFLSEYDEIEKILKENDDVFNPVFIKHWFNVHRPIMDSMLESITKINGMSQIVGFPLATECLIDYLNVTLFEIHELDCLLGSNLVDEKVTDNTTHSESVLLFVDDVTLDLGYITGNRPEVQRLNYYVQNVLSIDKQFPIEIRDYAHLTSNKDKQTSVYSAIRTDLANFTRVTGVEFVRRPDVRS
jgi:hypothetical protein